MRGIKQHPGLTLWRAALSFCAFLLMAMLAVSCTLTGFKQSAAVTLEVRFNSWDSVWIAKPNTRDNGFVPVSGATETLQAIERLNVPRGLAVVVVGSGFDDRQVRGIGVEWCKRLLALGYERVVVLRGTEEYPIAGLPIIHDSAISSGHDEPSHAP